MTNIKTFPSQPISLGLHQPISQSILVSQPPRQRQPIYPKTNHTLHLINYQKSNDQYCFSSLTKTTLFVNLIKCVPY